MAHWFTDTSPGFTIKGALLQHVQNPRETKPSHAMWQDGDGVSSGRHYWKVHFATLEGEAGVGLTSKDHFKQGYECQVVQYLTGDLSNGSSSDRLVHEFGPRPKEGDDIGVLAVFEDEKLKVYFDVNGVSLGLAFTLTDTTFRSIFPIVTFYNSGSATCTKLTEIPDITVRAPPTFTGIEGDWKLMELTVNNVTVDISRRCSCKIKRPELDLESDKYTWSVKVAISYRTTLSKRNGFWKSINGIISKKSATAADAESIRLENILKTLMLAVSAVEPRANARLFIRSDTTTSLWIRFDPTPGPFLGDPFGR